MPTGYTADVGDGKVTDFRTFALRCARAFGATTMQRDSSIDVLPQRREESTFYAEHVAEGEAEIARLAALSEAEAQRERDAEVEEVCTRNGRWRAEKDEKRRRYESMLVAVRRWEAPTPDHVEMKEFMAKQLAESIEFDCHELSVGEPESVTAVEWLMAKRVTAAEALAYDVKSLQRERERVTNANSWIDALYESLEESS